VGEECRGEGERKGVKGWEGGGVGEREIYGGGGGGKGGRGGEEKEEEGGK